MAVEKLEDYSNRLLDLEERFNREMEAARRRDLTEKEALKQRQRAARVELIEEFMRASAAKATSLVELFRQRELELENEFRRILEVERKKWTMMLRERDEDIAEMQRRMNGIAAVRPELQPYKEKVPAQSLPEIPYFGLEVEGTDTVTEPGVRVLAVTGPSAAAGLLAGDLIHQIIIPVQVRSQEDFLRALSKSETGDRVHIAVVRNNQLEKVVVVPERPLSMASKGRERPGRPVAAASFPAAGPQYPITYFE